MYNEEDDKPTVDYEELVRLLSEEESPKVKEPYKWKPNPHILRFIQKTGIESGDVRTPTYIIYYAFIKWAQWNWVKTWGNTEFFRTFNKYFKPKRTGRQRYYMLNASLDMSEEYEQKAKDYYKKWVINYNRHKSS
jgi:hypothetical protein